MFRKLLGAGVAGAALFALSAPAAAETLKLGALLPMTGDLQAYGQPSLNGITLAVEQIKAAGMDVSVTVGDTQTSPQPAVDAAQRLVSADGVSAILGALASGVSIPVAQSVSKVSGVPQMSGSATSPVITTLDDGDFMFRTVPSDAYQGVALGQVVAEQGITSVSVLYVNNDYGKGLNDSFTEAFVARGGTVHESVAFEPKQAAYRGELQRAAGEAEALVLIAYPETGQVILRQALEGGFFDRFIFTDGMKAPELIDAIGAEFLNGSFGTAPQAMADSPATEAFRTAYEEMFGELPPKPFIDTIYDATYLYALAAAKAGSTDPKAIRDTLRDVANPPGVKVGPGEFARAMELLADGQDIDYEGASGPVNLDANGDVGGTFAHWEIRDGAIETVTVFAPE